jgi:hypothetical protein
MTDTKYITPTQTWFSSHRTGGLENMDKEDIEKILGFAPNVEDDEDKVVNSWRCFVDGSPFAVWDYKGSHHARRWSIYDPEHKAMDIFPLDNISKF